MQISDLIDWVPIRHELDEMNDNKSEKGGIPNCDVVLMFKILILQEWYGLIDLEVERQMAERISFMAFLGFPNPFLIPGPYGCSKSAWRRLKRIRLSGRSFKDNWMLWVYESSVERSRMLHSLKQIQDHPTNHEAMMLRPGAVEMEAGLRKEMKFISVTSFIKKLISTTV